MSTAAETWNHGLQVVAISEVGMRRLNNQDAFIQMLAETEACWQQFGHMFVVADGMGAHAAGELASRIAVESVAHHYRKQTNLSPPEAILRAVRDSNRDIHQRGQANTDFHNMGTTCSVLLLLPQGALVAHVGDSRVYRFHGSKFYQMTFDHSLVWEMRAAGQHGRDAALQIPKNVITRSLGPHPMVQVDLEGPFPIAAGDRYLLCSDGLTAKVSDEEIGYCLKLLPVEQAGQLLVDLANLRGGPDNITLIIVKTADLPRVSNQRPNPLVVGTDLTPVRRVHPGIWISLFICWLLAAGLAISQVVVGALAMFLVGLFMLPIAAWQRYGGTEGVPLTGGRRLGRGPYVQIDVESDNAFVRDLTQSLCESLDDMDIEDMSRPRIDNCLEEANNCLKAGKHRECLQMICTAARIARNSQER